MSKYDFEIDTSLNTSTGLILSEIQPGSVVLEFGCAAGRMTRYMKEQLGCRVYIVELDEPAYETARTFAEDGLCDDIMTFRWVEQFSEISFDVIIFADVLEHLPEPGRVIAKASELLKQTGRLFVSVPNITHNDVLLKAYEEHFDYTSIGILDETHVHFWGLENLEQLSEESGLHIKRVQATYCPTGYTEQYGKGLENRYLLLNNLLRERAGGEIYQFVLTFVKDGTEQTEWCLRRPLVQSHIYFDTGNDFNDVQCVGVPAEYTGNGSYRVCYELGSADNIQRVRLDPIEFQSCVLVNVVICQAGQELTLCKQNAVETEQGTVLLGNDPFVFAETTGQKGPITVEAEFVLLGERYIQVLQHAVEQKVRIARCQLQELTEMLSAANEELRFRASDEARKNAKLHEHIAAQDKELEDLRRDLSAYVILSNEKELYILRLEKMMRRFGLLHLYKLCEFMVRKLRALKKKVRQVIRK